MGMVKKEFTEYEIGLESMVLITKLKKLVMNGEEVEISLT